MKTFNYVICGFGNSTLGFIIGLLEKNPNVNILVLEELSEENFYKDNIVISKEDMFLQYNDNGNIEKESFAIDNITKKNNRWNYGTIIGLEKEYEKSYWKQSIDSLENITQKYHFVLSDSSNTDSLIEENYREIQKKKGIVLLKSTEQFVSLNKKTFEETISIYIKSGSLEILFERKADRIVFGKKQRAKRLEVLYRENKEEYIVNEKLILGCGSKAVTDLLFKSGVGDKELMEKYGVDTVIENSEVGKNLIINPYIEVFYREQPKKHFFISQVEFFLSALEYLVFLQILIGIASCFFYNFLYTEIVISSTHLKILLFILLAGLDSFFLFVFRWNNFMIFGYLLGFLYIIALFFVNSQYYIRYWFYFLLYWVSYYVFYVIWTTGYFKYVGSRLTYASKEALKIYTSSSILSFYKKEEYERILRSGNSSFYRCLNFIYAIVYYYLWAKLWMYKELFIVRIETYVHNYSAFYRWSPEARRFILSTDFFRKYKADKSIYTLDIHEAFIRNMFISQKYAIYDTTASKKYNRRNVMDNVMFSGQVAGACAIEKVVENKTQKLVVSSQNESNTHIIGMPVFRLENGKRKTLNNTISLLNGYIIAKNN